MQDKCIKIGLDMGNKNLKVCSNRDTPHEIPIAYTEITEDEYNNELIGDSTHKVRYLNKYYLVGLQCNHGLPRNKGDLRYREIANMIKLVGLALDLKLNGEQEGVFNIVSGTPVEDYDLYKAGYQDMLLTHEEYEAIEVDKVEYKIKVKDVYVTKQSACLVPTIANWKSKNIMVFDLGGGTLDISHFVNGVKQTYETINFSLNNILAELGTYLNSFGLGLPRADVLNSGFINIMEDVVMEGIYQRETSISVEGDNIDLKDFCGKWLQNRVDNLINDIVIKLELSLADCKAIELYYIGGGAKMLRKQLATNNIFSNTHFIENPQFANVITYLTIASVRKEWL